MTTYRAATAADLLQLVQLSKEMHAETSFQSLSFSEPKIALELATFLAEPRNFTCVADRDGKLVGAIGAYLTAPIFSDDPVVFDHFWYVSQEARGSLVGSRLLKYVAQWAKVQGAKACFLTLGSDVSSDRVGQMAERLGYRRLGGFYRKDIDSV